MIHKKNHFMYDLAEEFNQLYLPIDNSEENSEKYKDIILRGKSAESKKMDFTLDKMDSIEIIKSDAGPVRCIYLKNRCDFEKLVKHFANQCRPMDIPKSMGSIVIVGINNWRKIHQHKKNYKKDGGEEWNQEFKKFTSKKDNYKESMIIISEGSYSAIDKEDRLIEGLKWNEISKQIRKFHEITHFVCIKKYPELKEIIFDEILADYIGILFALGYYHKNLALKCLGISEQNYLRGGRLENYIELNNITSNVCNEIIMLSNYIEKLIDVREYKNEVKLGINGLIRIIDDIYSDEYILDKIAQFKVISS